MLKRALARRIGTLERRVAKLKAEAAAPLYFELAGQDDQTRYRVRVTLGDFGYVEATPSVVEEGEVWQEGRARTLVIAMKGRGGWFLQPPQPPIRWPGQE